MSRILDNLYLGSYADAKNQTLLISLGITHIVTVGAELKTLYPRLFKYLYIPAHDSPEYRLIMHFDEIADFIHEGLQKKTGKVFVHCYWGISRSTASVMAYLIKYQNMETQQARIFVKQKREIVYPNEGFLKQLETFAKKVVSKTKKTTSRFLGKSSKIKESAGSNEPIPTNQESKFPALGRSPSFVIENQISALKTIEQKKSMIAGYAEGILRDTVNKSNPSPTYRAVALKKLITGKKNNSKYGCKECGTPLFNSFDIFHNGEQEEGNKCNAFYLRNIPWLGSINANTGTVCCPNSKCNKTIGYIDKKGGRCSCGKSMKSLFIIYPLKVFQAKDIIDT